MIFAIPATGLAVLALPRLGPRKLNAYGFVGDPATEKRRRSPGDGWMLLGGRDLEAIFKPGAPLIKSGVPFADLASAKDVCESGSTHEQDSMFCQGSFFYQTARRSGCKGLTPHFLDPFVHLLPLVFCFQSLLSAVALALSFDTFGPCNKKWTTKRRVASQKTAFRELGCPNRGIAGGSLCHRGGHLWPDPKHPLGAGVCFADVALFASFWVLEGERVSVAVRTWAVRHVMLLPEHLSL